MADKAPKTVSIDEHYRPGGRSQSHSLTANPVDAGQLLRVQKRFEFDSEGRIGKGFPPSGLVSILPLRVIAPKGAGKREGCE